MRTTPIIWFGQNAIVIKDATASFIFTPDGLQSFASFDDIMTGATNAKPYATYEPDFWLLDGNYKFMGTNPHTGVVSANMSASDGTTNSALTVYFSTPQSTTDGITIYFSEATGDWCEEISLTYLDSGGALIRGPDIYYPTGAVFSTNQAVSNFKTLGISLAYTNKPYRYVRISRLDFDTVTQFTGTQIKNAKLMEQIDPLSLEIPVNTLDFSLFSSDASFNIINPSGAYANILQRQPIEAYENLGGEIVYLGRFYIDSWDAPNNTEIAFKCVDMVGVLDKLTFPGIFISGSGFLASTVVDLIFDGSGIDYEIDPSLASVTIKGYIPPASCRETLQHLAFRIGGYVTCARSNIVSILPLELASGLSTFDYTLTSADKGMESPLTLRPMVTGVEAVAHQYNQNSETPELYNSTLAVGSYRILFTAPSRTYSLGGTATYSYNDNTTYVDVTVTVAGTVVITQITGWTDTTSVRSVYNTGLAAGTVQNIIKVSDVGIITEANASTIAQRIYNYYQQRYLQKTKLFASRVTVGSSVLIDTLQGSQIKGIVEKMETDLTGGFRSEIEIIGVVA